MKITLLDGSIKEFDQPLSIKEIASKLAISLGKATIGGILDKKFKVASDFVIDKDYFLELITDKSEKTIYDNFISTTASAISSYAFGQVFPDAEIAEQFYDRDNMEFAFTFKNVESLKLEELQDVQTKISELLKSDLKIANKKITDSNGLNLNTYQLHTADEMIANFGFAILTKINDFSVISSQPICVESKLVKAIKLSQLTGSYWLEDAKNIMLQRIHGLGATSEKELENKENELQERRSRDHRVINRQLEIFHFDPLIGQGLPIWLPNGVVLKDEIKKYLKGKEWEYDYVQVQTPVIGTLDLYRTSGHMDHYRDDMFQPFKGGNEEFVLKPMSCPHHIAIYRQKQRSYRDLPLRYAEHALQHRFESSGSLTGLERVRAMELTDSHIFLRQDQVEDEFKSIYQLIEEVLSTFKIKIDYLSFSVRDPEDKEKYYQNDEMWNRAEADMEKILKDLKMDYKKMVGEAAFYGPKLDIQAKTALGHEITVSTIQLDFLLPERFNLGYIDDKGENVRPIMIHRGLIGTYERFIATLLEQTKGVLPLWLAPVQVEIIPVNSDSVSYSEEIKKDLKKMMIRSHIDLRDERLSYKIRDAQVHKIPYQLVLGTKEIDNNNLTYREYGSEDQITISRDDFYKLLEKRITNKN